MSEKKMSDLRVHIVPVGYDTYTRVTVPLEQMDANKIYFIKHEKGAIRGHEKFFSKIKNIVKQSNKKFEEKYIDIWDLYKCLELYRVIISKEIKKRNHVFINVSTGTKVTAMAGILACMIFNQTPYYVRLKNPTKKKMTRIPYVAVADPQNMPTFEIKKPSDVILKILNQISKSKYKMLRKWQLIKYLEKEGKIRQLSPNKPFFSDNAKLSQLKTILEPIEKYWEYVTVEYRGSRSEVKITDEGEKALRIFGTESN